MMKTFLITLLVSFSAHAETMISCNDGDTCRFLIDGKSQKVRLSGIDAPETGQPYATESRDFLISLLKGKNVALECTGMSWDRHVCEVKIGKTDILSELVKAGWAMDYPQYSNGKYASDEKLAREAKRGIWADPKLVSPFCFRYLGHEKCKGNTTYKP